MSHSSSLRGSPRAELSNSGETVPVTAREGEQEAEAPLSSPASSAATPDVPAGNLAPLPGASEADRRQAITARAPTLRVLAILAVIYSLYFARAVCLPIVTAFVLALLFRPVVRVGRRYRIPEAVTAGGVLALILGGLLGLAIFMVEPAEQWIEKLPRQVHVIGKKMAGIRSRWRQFNDATAKVEQIAAGHTPAAPPAPLLSQANETTLAAGNPEEAVPSPVVVARPLSSEPVPVEMRQPRLVTGMAFLSTTTSFLGELFVSLVLAYFLLSSGDVLINNVLKILPSMREKRNVVELVYNVERGISAYLVTVAAINGGLGIVIGLVLWALGMPNAALWGGLAALLNFVPYLGALLGMGIVFLIALLTFDSFAYACVIPIAYFACTAIEGNFITPHLLGKSMSLNPIMVFLSLTIGWWMWGTGGAILAVPIVAMLKVGFDQFEGTRAMGTLLGGSGSL